MRASSPPQHACTATGDQLQGAAAVISAKQAAFAGEENPISEIHVQCKFNFTRGAIKPSSNHLVLLVASPVNPGNVI